MSDHAANMQVAIQEALRARGLCHPNPAVGAVIEHQGTIVARGHTQAPGGSHAEVEAIQSFLDQGFVPDKSTILYVTLEPCCTHGRTPACTDLIMRRGFRHVVVGATDPNPLHAGKGFTLLKAAGVTVESGVCEAECADLNPAFNHWMETGAPLFAAKIATTLDGRIATRSGHSRWITGEAARQDVARWRRAFPGIAVGGGTVVRDDPQLTSRPEGEPLWCPWRLIFDRAGLCLTQPDRQVFSDTFAARTIYITSELFQKRIPEIWRERGVQLWTACDWADIRERCLASSITGIYVEGGPRLLGDLLRARQLHYLFAYRAPVWLGDAEALGPFSGFAPESMDHAFRLNAVKLEHFGADQLMRGEIIYPDCS